MTHPSKNIALLFDWDGTLVDTIHVLTKAYNDVFVHFNMPTWTIEDGKKRIRTSSRETFPQMFGDRTDEALQIYYASVEKNHLEHLHKMEGVEEFLAHMQKFGIPMGVISNKRDSYLKKEVEYLGWGDYFTALVGAGRAGKDKPAPEAMTIAINEMALPSANLELWYVGDTETDMEFAANFGCKKAFISHGFGTLEEAEKYRPDLIASGCAELGKQLDTVFNLR